MAGDNVCGWAYIFVGNVYIICFCVTEWGVGIGIDMLSGEGNGWRIGGLGVYGVFRVFEGNAEIIVGFFVDR